MQGKVRQSAEAQLYVGIDVSKGQPDVYVHPLGLAEIDIGLTVVRFCGRDLGTIDRTGRFCRFAPPRGRLRYAAETAGTNKE